MQKSVSKRIKITKNKKIMRRVGGRSHFLSKKSSLQIRRKKNLQGLYLGRKIVRKYLSA